MYRKPRGGGSQSILNLDSLMDILSCLVGVMLFLVIYTVLELGSTTYQVSVPVPLDRPQEARRILVLANDLTGRPPFLLFRHQHVPVLFYVLQLGFC